MCVCVCRTWILSLLTSLRSLRGSLHGLLVVITSWRLYLHWWWLPFAISYIKDTLCVCSCMLKVPVLVVSSIIMVKKKRRKKIQAGDVQQNTVCIKNILHKVYVMFRPRLQNTSCLSLDQQNHGQWGRSCVWPHLSWRVGTRTGNACLFQLVSTILYYVLNSVSHNLAH